MKTFGNILRELRKEKNITQRELASMLKLSESTIGMYERNERQPDYDTLNRIANYFKVTTDFLLGRKSKSVEHAPKDIFDDPELGLWFKDIKDSTPEKREELKQFWEFIKSKEQFPNK